MLKKLLGLMLLTGSVLYATTVTSVKDIYHTEDAVVVEVSDMLGDSEDWVGIYPAGASNDWENVVSWRWTNGVKNGTITLDRLPAGNYEVRAFFQNSFHVEASDSFRVDGVLHTSVKTSKKSYTPDEAVVAEVANMLGDSEDWVGIYPAGASNDWENVVSWRWTNGVKNGTITLDKLPAGNYEVRVFFRNSFKKEASYAFDVKDPEPAAPIVYEDGEGALADWVTVEGNQVPFAKAPGYEGGHCVKFPTKWRKINGQWHNEAEYRLYFEETTNTVFEMDIGGVGENMPHYFVGVHVRTLNGDRRMFWDSWYNHQGSDPKRYVYGDTVLLFYPSPVELVRGFGYADVDLWEHFKVDLNQQLQLLEPDNRVLGVSVIAVSGGFLDNITLSPAN